jgi:hypothetical protein
VTFTPAATGQRSALLTLASNANGSPHSVALAGTGTQAPPPQTYTVTVTTSGPGQAVISPAGPYAGNAVVTLTPSFDSNATVFLGWTVDGVFQGWPDPLDFTINNANHTVLAQFAPRPAFPDVTNGTPGGEAIAQLAARGSIKGYGDGRFGPGDSTQRAQMAALIARSMGWDVEDHGNPFTDRGGVDTNLWRNVGTLYFYNVARGYAPQSCQDRGKIPPCFGPTEQVTQAQTISFITRAMVTKGYWQQQPDDPALYPNISIDSGHRIDLATYVHYAGAAPGTDPAQPWATWSEPSTRGWFAQALWQALDGYFKVDRLP